MSSRARRKELAAIREEDSRQEWLEQVRISNLSLYDRMSEAETIADMKAIIEIVCERAGIDIYQ
ncbi:hypothetical protein [Rhizobium sp. 12,4]|uniref:hypothetical protein n=1 Tax=Rhizobium sp. 12,4 TaxID=3405135 RepID=UPI003D329DA1